MFSSCRSVPVAVALVLAVSSAVPAAVAEPAVDHAAQKATPRTLMVGIEIDRDAAQVVAYTLKQRPYLAPPLEAARHFAAAEAVQVEVELIGPNDRRVTARVDLAGLCLLHEPTAAPHVEGDTIQHHRESFIVELPELDGFRVVEVAYYDGETDAPERRAVAVDALDVDRFTPAAGPFQFTDLAFATVTPVRSEEPPAANAALTRTPGTVHWPEEYSDPDIFRVYGSEAEVPRRINIVLVPDGYLYSEKAQMESHASSMVGYFRTKTPFREHDAFINYVLVYGYSTESGTDECDCGTILDTAFSTRFPDEGAACGNAANRCLYYGAGCDPGASTANIVAAELRAPAKDTTVVMVNTARYGGCGGARATYSAGNSSATEVAVHELGHSLAGLADEYGGAGCAGGNGVNVSSDPVNGNWPEWISALGAPREGGRYRDQCTYRPLGNCDMRSLNQPFCPVCNQQWALRYFGHSRVRPTAPIEAQTPPSPVMAMRGVPTDFGLVTRLASGPTITNRYTWTLDGPGLGGPTVVGTSAALNYSFPQTGVYTLSAELVADTNYIKPEKFGANVDTVEWTVDVCCCDAAPSIGGPATAVDIDPCAATGIELNWPVATFGISGGTYEVWRDLALVASGVLAPPYVDVPGDSAPHVYDVVAIANDCATRSAPVSVGATDATGPASLPVMGNVLRAYKTVGVQLTWADSPGAVDYLVARSEARDFGAPLTTVGTVSLGLPGIGDPASLTAPLYTYRVAATQCSTVGPW